MVDSRIKRRIIKRSKKKIKTSFGNDLLQEIFIRLSDCATAIRCSAVCKTWSSLIRNPDFIHSFCHSRRLLDPRPLRPYTHLLRWERGINFRGFCQLSSLISSDRHELGKPLRFRSRHFLPWPATPDVKIRATHGDLLLVSRSQWYYAICNPLTGQSLALPRAPRTDANYSGLAFESKSCDKKHMCNCNIRFRVVLLSGEGDLEGDDSLIITAVIFCSETGQWTESELRDNPVASSSSSTLLHWKMGDCIVAFDPFNHQNRFRQIKLPAGVKYLVPVGLVGGRGLGAVLVGSVKGRPRLVHVNSRSLRVWELNYSGSGDGSSPSSSSSSTPEWLLVHRRTTVGDRVARLRAVAFHPDDGDVIFLVRDYDDHDNRVYQYNIADGKLVADCKIQWLDIWQTFKNKFRKVFTLTQYRSWPTSIPPLVLENF